MPRTRAYLDGKLTDSDFPVDQLSEHLDAPGAVVWVDLCSPDRTDLALISAELDLHHLAVEDATTEHQVLMSGLDTHGTPSDGLLTRTAEAVDGDARGLDRPTGRQHRHTSDAVGLVAGGVAVADDHVVDVRWVEADALLGGIEHLCQQFLGMDLVQRAVGLALASRRPHSVDDPRLAHQPCPSQPVPNPSGLRV